MMEKIGTGIYLTRHQLAKQPAERQWVVYDSRWIDKTMELGILKKTADIFGETRAHKHDARLVADAEICGRIGDWRNELHIYNKVWLLRFDAKLTVNIFLKVVKIHLVGYNLVGKSRANKKINREFAGKTKLIEQWLGVVVVDGPKIHYAIVHLGGLIDNLGLLAAMLHLVGIDENHGGIFAVVLEIRLVFHTDIALVEKLGGGAHVDAAMKWDSTTA